MDWSGRRIFFGSGGVGDNTLGECGRFCGADLSFRSVACWVVALDDLFFAARINLYPGLSLDPVSSEGSLAHILRSL